MPNLSHYLPLFESTRNKPRPGNISGLKIGRFSLLKNPVLCSDFLSFVAPQESNFPSFEQWQKFLKADHRPPKKPDRDNPNLYQNPDYSGRNDLEARTYRAYIFTRKMEIYRDDLHKIEQKQEKQRAVKNRYSNDKAGYCHYIYDRLSPTDRIFLDKYLSFSIPEEKQILHSYISGGTGSGKSEIMKTLLHHYLTENQKTALVLIDPHGKIAQEVAQFKENADNDRLIFISPDFSPTSSPIFNIFDSADTLTPQALDIATQEIVGAFREILQDVGFTPQMETLLKPCIATLLLYPKGNLYHLQQFMDTEENAELLRYADKYLSNPAQKNFLKTDFLKSAYAPSRQSIRTKIQSLLNSQIFLNFTLGKSTFSLAEAIQKKKLIVFSLSRNSGAETSDTIGRLILASLQSLAMQRANLSPEALENAPPIHLFIDECQHYITPSIDTVLTETRKYKLYLTLANQFLGQIENRKIRNAIKGNTALKITGRQTEPDTLASIAKITSTDPQEIRDLKTGEYHIKAGELQSVKVEGNTNCLDSLNSMNAKQWEAVEARQIALYYCTQDTKHFEHLEEKAPTPQTLNTAKKKKKRGLN